LLNKLEKIFQLFNLISTLIHI